MCYQHTAHEAAGATGTRHSPRPLLGEWFTYNSGASRREIVESYLKFALCKSNPSQFIECERATLCVVPAHAGTHNHHRLLEQKPLATVPKREAAAYVVPAPVRNCALVVRFN